MKSVGKQLEDARQGRNWTPEAAAKVTKIRVEQLLDIERDDFTRFPSPAYARGFVRLYSKALGLDDRRMLAQLDGRLEVEDESGFIPAPSVEYIPQRTEITTPIRVNRFGVKIILVLLGIFAVLFLFTLFTARKAGVPLSAAVPKSTEPKTKRTESSQAKPAVDDDKIPVAKPMGKEKDKDKDKEKDNVPMAKPASAADLAKASEPPKAEPVAPVAPSTQANAVVPAGGKHALILQANRVSYVRVTAIERDGEKIMFEGLLQPSESKSFEATQFKLLVAVPSAIDIVFDGYNNGPYKESDTPETFSIP